MAVPAREDEAAGVEEARRTHAGSPRAAPTQAVEILRDISPLTGPSGPIFRSMAKRSEKTRYMSDNTINSALRALTSTPMKTSARFSSNQRGIHPIIEAQRQRPTISAQRRVRGTFSDSVLWRLGAFARLA
ncbi:hypothetical protein J2X90_005698 [Variovorax paradoxus]|uniref:hypothetical protein n=1 Tax=Variovorax paradoxus TaxID=34073 RepID=UPI0027876C9F|nr:hypothetical protein [Variovorax paradoxus]MDQ0027862.1 hypothetical protein [Variovorax paradoxus]